MDSGALLIVFGAFAGLIAGSFIGALATRWLRGESVTHGRSRCDGCARTLHPLELIPLIGFLLARGRCRACGAPIAPAHLVAELASMLIGASAFAAAPVPEAIAGALFGWTLVALALLDAEHFWLPDRLTLPLAAAGIAASAAGVAVPLRDGLIGAIVGYAGLAALGLLYRLARGRHGLGGGDPKLLAAIGAWLGWAALPFVLLLASLAGLASLLRRRLAGGTVSAQDRLPLGTLLAVAAWPVWLLTRAF